MLLVQLLLVVVLLLIFLQDLKKRGVFWIWFPMLTAGLLFIRLHSLSDWDEWSEIVEVNAGMLSLLLLLLAGYFSWKRKRLTNLTKGLLCWGDILFLFCITVYFSTANFVLFYIISLTVSLVTWISLMKLKQAKTKRIPLAGFQAMILLFFLMAEWWPHWISLSDDTWYLNLIQK